MKLSFYSWTVPLVAALSLVALSIAPATAQILNGGFENPVTGAGSLNQFAGGSNIAGVWNVTGADVLVLNTTYAESGILFNANSGSNALDITGAGNTSPNDGVNQTINTNIGSTYVISFFVGRGDDTGFGTNYQNASTVDLSIAGGPRVPFTNANLTPNQINWQQFFVPFVATGTTTNIAFFNGTPAVNNNYAGLDDVSVSLVTVPEPGTVALVLPALGVLGVVLARRRQ